MSSSSLERSYVLEHPVTVILLDEKNGNKNWSKKRTEAEDGVNGEGTRGGWKRVTEKNDLEKDEHSVEVLEIAEGDAWKEFSSSSRAWSMNAPSLARVNVIVDDDDRTCYDDDDDADDDVQSSEESELFRSSASHVFTGSQAFRNSSGDVFLSGDDSASNVEIHGHVTRREMEVVEHETTRKCVILAPNTKLDSDDDEEEEERESLVTMVTAEKSAYDEAAARYHSSIRNQDFALPVVVFKMDSETQTTRCRTTQTGVDQSTQTLEKRKSQGVRRLFQKNPDDWKRTCDVEEEDEDRYSTVKDQLEWKEEVSRVTEDSSRILSRETDRDGPPELKVRTTPEMVSVGHQTSSHCSTQTPVLVRLGAGGGLWTPQETILLTGLEGLGTGKDQFFHPLDNRYHLDNVYYLDNGDHLGDLGTSLGHRSPPRDFATQTFGQMSGNGVQATTQTRHGNGIHDDSDYQGNERGAHSRKKKRSRHKRDKLNDGKKNDDDSKNKTESRTKNRTDSRTKNRTKNRTESDEDEGRKDLLKLMLHEIKALKRTANEKEMGDKKENEKDDRRKSSSRKESTERIGKWKDDVETRKAGNKTSKSGKHIAGSRYDPSTKYRHKDDLITEHRNIDDHSTEYLKRNDLGTEYHKRDDLSTAYRNRNNLCTEYRKCEDPSTTDIYQRKPRKDKNSTVPRRTQGIVEFLRYPGTIHQPHASTHLEKRLRSGSSARDEPRRKVLEETEDGKYRKISHRSFPNSFNRDGHGSDHYLQPFAPLDASSPAVDRNLASRFDLDLRRYSDSRRHQGSERTETSRRHLHRI